MAVVTFIATFLAWIVLAIIGAAAQSDIVTRGDMSWHRAATLTLYPALALAGAFFLMANLAGVSWAQ